MTNQTARVTLLLDVVQTAVAVVSLFFVLETATTASSTSTSGEDAMCHTTPFAIEVMAGQHHELHIAPSTK